MKEAVESTNMYRSLLEINPTIYTSGLDRTLRNLAVPLFKQYKDHPLAADMLIKLASNIEKSKQK